MFSFYKLCKLIIFNLLPFSIYMNSMNLLLLLFGIEYIMCVRYRLHQRRELKLRSKELSCIFQALTNRHHTRTIQTDWLVLCHCMTDYNDTLTKNSLDNFNGWAEPLGYQSLPVTDEALKCHTVESHCYDELWFIQTYFLAVPAYLLCTKQLLV